MKYMFIIFNEQDAEEMSPADEADWQAFGVEAAEVATFVGTRALRSPETATVVSVRDGETFMTDGPFIETKEHFGGYVIFDCPDLDVALDLAARMPCAPTGFIEVRPILE